MPQPSILDARLAEIDRRLRTIQSGLTPADHPAPAAGDAPSRAEGAAFAGPSLDDELRRAEALVRELRQLTAVHERLLNSSRELLSTFAGTLARRPEPRSSPGAVPPSEGPSDASSAAARMPLSVVAGPFADTAAVRRFEQALTELSEVREVAVREYAGGDRVVLDVHLSAPTS